MCLSDLDREFWDMHFGTILESYAPVDGAVQPYSALLCSSSTTANIIPMASGTQLYVGIGTRATRASSTHTGTKPLVLDEWWIGVLY